MPPRVTLRQIARLAGFHLTTVARAVKNDPRVRPATATKIKALATKLGYVADPMLDALNAYRRVARPPSYRETIAWVVAQPRRSDWAEGALLHYFEGALESLKRHGYRLEEFYLREPGLTDRRASQILVSRGIRGLLVCPLPVSCGHLSLDWNRFCTMTFGYSLARPEFHLATSSHYHAANTCLRRLRTLGYQRIGLALSSSLDIRMNRLWTAAYLVSFFPQAAMKPYYFADLDSSAAEERAEEGFRQWCEKHRPDAIVTADSDLRKWLRARPRISNDVGLAGLNLQEKDTTESGIVEASHAIGRAAGDFLAAMIQRGEYGIPRTPQRILLDGRWRDGRSLKKVGSR